MKDAALVEAILAAGGTAALARSIGVSGPAISQWPKCPAGRVLAVEKASGVSRHKLRPDIYPPESSQEAA